jgi:molecular chaperone GrpE
VIRDNRKIDRGDGGVGTAAAPEPPVEEHADESADANAVLLEERTRDLQRVQAEYANYRKRADRERLAAGDLAVSRVLTDLLPVLDDLDRARAHGDLTGGLKAVADHLDSVFSKLGLVSFGEVGDPFDPEIHEAVMHDESAEVTEPTCTTVMRPGYLHNDRLLRPAMVGVSDPADPAPAADDEPALQAEPAPADEKTEDQPAE